MIEWLTPNAGELTSVVELDAGNPLFECFLECQQITDSNTLSTAHIFYEVIAGQIPQYYSLDHISETECSLKISPIVRELDEYVSEYAKPDNFSWNTESKSGGNYASFGSAQSGGKTMEFTIRAYELLSPDFYLDSNGFFQYNIDSNTIFSSYVDRDFSITVTNNWSSDRDSFLKEYYQNESLTYNGQSYTIDDWIVLMKSLGYYD